MELAMYIKGALAQLSGDFVTESQLCSETEAVLGNLAKT
jgi:hypothetical protein